MLKHKQIRTLILFFTCMLFCISRTAWAQSAVGVTVDQTTPGQAASPDFEGFSVEMLLAFPDSSGNYLFNGNNTTLIGMFKSRGIKGLRTGGSSAGIVADTSAHLPIDSTSAASAKVPNP